MGDLLCASTEDFTFNNCEKIGKVSVFGVFLAWIFEKKLLTAFIVGFFNHESAST